MQAVVAVAYLQHCLATYVATGTPEAAVAAQQQEGAADASVQALQAQQPEAPATAQLQLHLGLLKVLRQIAQGQLNRLVKPGQCV